MSDCVLHQFNYVCRYLCMLMIMFDLICSLILKRTGGNSNVAQKPGSSSTSNVNATSTGQTGDKSFIVHSDTGKDSSESGRESITFSKTKQGMLLRPAHVRKTPTKQSVAVQSSTPKQSESDGEKTLDTKAVLDSEESGRKPFDAIDSIIKSITSKFEKALFPESPTDKAKCKFSQCTSVSPDLSFQIV